MTLLALGECVVGPLESVVLRMQLELLGLEELEDRSRREEAAQGPPRAGSRWWKR